MIAKTRQACPVQGSWSKNLEAITQFRYFRTHGTQIVRDCGDTIAFLDAQFFRVANNRLAVCKSAGDCKYRQFINKLRYFLTLNDSTFKGETSNFNIHERLNLIDVLNRL